MTRFILWGLAFFWLVILTFLSSQSGQDTSKVSLRLARFLLQLMNIPNSKLEEFHLALRTFAHFGGFFIFGLIIHVAFYTTFPDKKLIWCWVGVLGSGVGILDEVKKLFIAGRHLSWLEAGLNILGLWCGVCAAAICITGRRLSG